MNIPDDIKFKMRGCSLKRTAYLLSGLGLALVPVHCRVACEASRAVGCMGTLLALGAGILCLLIPRNDPRRLWPAAFALAVLMAHLASIH